MSSSHQCDPDCPHIREDQLDFGTTLFQQIDLSRVFALNSSNQCMQLKRMMWHFEEG